MPYHRLEPAEDLRPYVDAIWIQERTADPVGIDVAPTTVLPTGNIDLVFQYGRPFAQIVGDGMVQLPTSYLAGQRTRPVAVKASGDTGIIIVSFFPWGARAFVDMPLVELRDKSVDLKDTHEPAGVSDTEDRLRCATSSTDRLRVVEAWLRRVLDERKTKVGFIRAAIGLINDGSGCRSIPDTAAGMNVSRRHLARRFDDEVGLSPKQFSSVIRCQKAIYHLRRNASWSDVSLRYGFYDQPHFIRTMKKFSRLTPTALVPSSPDTPLRAFFNDPAGLRHFYNTIYL